MNKSELTDKVANKAGLTKKQAGECVDAVMESISEALSNQSKVSLKGFGTFEIRKRSARSTKNPQTGEVMQIPSKKVPFFKPAQALKDQVK